MQYFTNESFMALLCLSNTLAGAFLHLKKIEMLYLVIKMK